MEDSTQIKTQAKKELQKVSTLAELDQLWRAYFGSSGKISLLLREIKKVPAKKRPAFGKEIHALKAYAENLFKKRKAALEESARAQKFAAERIDVTRPGKKVMRGGLHPLTIVRQEIEAIFATLGFSVVTGPEVETEYYNFDALNIPRDHPARDLWDTLWLQSSQIQNPKSPPAPRSFDSESLRLDELQRAGKIQSNDSRLAIGDKLLLRTHTSPVQVRYMEQHQPPFRIIAPGRVFRYEATDASHDIQFNQVEGLMVGYKDTNPVTIANFKAVISAFFEQFFQKSLTIRLRPSYFPFVEPGFEVDVTCTVCGGSGRALRQAQGCSVCAGTGWLEMMGAGMVHPAVFEAVKYNPLKVQGFAFGMGMERLAMMKWRIPDVRLFRSGDVRFLKQF